MTRRRPSPMLLAVTAAAALSACSRRAGGDPTMIVPEWKPIVRELQARGVSDPVILVGVLATYELPLASGQQVWGRLPKAFPTVASVVDRDVTALRTAYVARSATASAAATLLSELKALEPKLHGLPGVTGRPTFGGAEPAQLALGMRQYAALEGIPMPTTSRASPEWVPLLQELRARGFDDPDVALFVVHQARLRFRSGAVIEPLDEDARYLTVAAAFELDPARFRREFIGRMLETVPGGPSPIPRAREARAVLAGLAEVGGIEEVPLALPPEPVKEYREGDELLAPPWEAFPEPPTSLRWRMGAGEDYLDRWLPFWRGLPASGRSAYLGRHPPPESWKRWVDDVR